MAPDLMIDRNQTYSEKVDVWSLGIMFYELLIGKPPFYGKAQESLIDKINDGDYIFP